MDVVSTGTLMSVGTATSSNSSYKSDKSSDRSNTSGNAGEKEKSRDLTRDNSASPIDLECHIQQERITKILDEAMYKTKLAIALPAMVRDYTILNDTLAPQHMEDLIFIFEQYENPLFSESLLNMAAMDDIKAGDISLKNRLNPELGHLMYILNSYPQLKSFTEETIERMKTEYMNQEEPKDPNPTLEYLMTFEKFRGQMVNQMALTAAEELGEKLRIRKIERNNEKLISKIQEYAETIRKEQEEFEKQMSDKAELIAGLEKELKFFNNAAGSKLRKKILDSERQMVLMSRRHAVKNEMLKEEEVETRENYETTLRNHLAEESAQRARRFKVETQLLSWLQKYDTEMTDKQQELDDYEAKYKEELKKIEILERRLEDQNAEYLPLMKEREDEYDAEMTAKMNAFLIEHSARVIQFAWREVMANRAEKKKLRKILKQVKLERERQERREELARKEEEKQAKKNKALQKKELKEAMKAAGKAAAAKVAAEAAEAAEGEKKEEGAADEPKKEG